MIRNITDEQARHMVELFKEEVYLDYLIKNFSHKLEKYRMSGDKKTFKKSKQL